MRKNKRKSKAALISNIIFAVIALFALSVSLVMLFINYKMKEQYVSISEEVNELREFSKIHTYTYEDLENKATEVRNAENSRQKEELLEDIKTIMNEGNSAYYLLRYLYPEDVVVVANGGYNFFPIKDTIPLSKFPVENYVIDEESGEISYFDPNGEVQSLKGIDVSSFQGDIDWKKVKNDGIDFAIIRLGYRGSTEGALKLDSTFEKNIEGALDNGIKVGVYFYTQATSTAEAIEEADFVLDAISKYNVEFPVAYDIEVTDGGRADDLSIDEYTEYAIAFLERIKEAGYTPMVYGNLYSLFMMLDTEKVSGYDTWFAYYAQPVYYPYQYTIWQYTDAGSVDGIKGKVDMNVCLKNY